jgi:outer membrane biosynthesis protein TonB
MKFGRSGEGAAVPCALATSRRRAASPEQRALPLPVILIHALSLLLLAILSAKAQNADEFFHGGAQHFLTNNIPGALEVVTNGLQQFPEDEKLKKLYELLNQQQQQQQQQQQKQEQKQQDQDKKDEQKQDQHRDQQKQDDQKDQESKSEQQKQEEQKKQEEAQKKKAQEKKEQQANSGDESRDKPEEKPGEPQQVAAHQMTPQEAKQLLEAQKDEEKVLIFQPQGEPKNRAKQLKDW